MNRYGDTLRVFIKILKMSIGNQFHWIVQRLALLLAAGLLGISLMGARQVPGRNLSGQILDEQGNGIAGASIIVKGSTRGVMADENGRFSIEVSRNDVLVISFLGYEDKEELVGQQDDIVIRMVP